MSLNKSKGNMYNWCDFTWNPIRGKCPHRCTYCFMRGRDVGALRLDKKALADNLGKGRTIFVGSSTDMWADAVPGVQIWQVLNQCRYYDGNKYIFQSKNPNHFLKFTEEFPPKTILGTTLESNREYGQSIHAPLPAERVAGLANWALERFEKMVSIEPVMAFDLEVLTRWLKAIGPKFVSIGADSKGHNLIEPTVGELDMLIVGLRKFTEVKLKYNLGRLLEREIKEA